MIAPSQLTAHHAAAPALIRVAPRRAQRSTNSVRCFSTADGTNVVINFSMPYRCKFGQRLCVIGAQDTLGAWDVVKAIPMEWTEGDVWSVDMNVPSDGSVVLDYKYVVRSEEDMEAVRWKEGGNFQLRLPNQGRLRVRDTWDESCREVEIETQTVMPDGTVRRRRRKVDEDAELQASISKAADKAMQQLDAAVTRSMDLLGTTADPGAPELLAADRLVAAAAKRATTMNRALDSAKEAKLLGSGKGSASGSANGAASGAPRRRRAAVNREGGGARNQ